MPALPSSTPEASAPSSAHRLRPRKTNTRAAMNAILYFGADRLSPALSAARQLSATLDRLKYLSQVQAARQRVGRAPRYTVTNLVNRIVKGPLPCRPATTGLRRFRPLAGEDIRLRFLAHQSGAMAQSR
jgi:hypothetical protein